MDDEDFDLQPLDGYDEDEDDVDAKNDDTFADGGALGDDWQPDAAALGAFEALRIATLQQGLRERGQREQQQQSPPPHSFLQQKDEDAEYCGCQYAAALPLPQQSQQEQRHLVADQDQQQLPLRHDERLWHPSLQQQQQEQQQQEHPQACPSQLQQQQQPVQQLHGRTSAEGNADAMKVQQTRGSVGSNLQSSSRSTVTEQLNRLIAYKRQQHSQQQAPSGWLLSTAAGPDAAAPLTTPAAATTRSGAGSTCAARPAAPLDAAAPGAASEDAGPSAAAGMSYAAASSAEEPFFGIHVAAGSAADHPPADARSFLEVESFTSRSGGAAAAGGGVASVASDVYAAVAGSTAAAASDESGALFTHTGGAARTATAEAARHGDAPDAATVLLARRAPPGLQLQQPFPPSSAYLQQQQQPQNKYVKEPRPPAQLQDERETFLAAADYSSPAPAVAAALTLSRATGYACAAQGLASSACGPALLPPRSPAAAGSTPAGHAAADAGGEAVTEEEQRRMLMLLLKNLNITAAALAATDISVATAGASTGAQQLQRQLREHLESPQQQLRQELRHLQQQQQQQQRDLLQRGRQQQHQAGEHGLQEQQEQLLRQQQRLLQFLRPGEYVGGPGEAAAVDAGLAKDVEAAVAAAAGRQQTEATVGIAGAATQTHVREGQFEQPDSRMPPAPAALRPLWGAALSSSSSGGSPQLQQPQQQRQEPTQEHAGIRLPVASLALPQNSRAVVECCAPAVVGPAAASWEPAGQQTQRDKQQQQRLQQQVVHHVPQPYGNGTCSSSSSGNSSVHEGRRAEKKVFTEAEVLQMLTAASRRSSSEKVAATSVHPLMKQQQSPLDILPRFQPEQQQMDQHMLQQRQGQARQQQQQPPESAQYEETEEPEHVQQHASQLPSEVRSLQLQRQQQEQQQQHTDSAWSSGGEQLQEGLYPGILRSVAAEDDRWRRQQELQQMPLPPAAPQQQQQLQLEAHQQNGRRHAAGTARNNEKSREAAARGRVASAAAQGTGEGNAAKAAAAAATCLLQGPFTGTPAASVAEVVPLAARDASAGMPSRARGPGDKAVAEGSGISSQVDVRSALAAAAARDTAGSFVKGATATAAGGKSTRAASSLATIRASGLFPLTKAHLEMAVKQRLPELMPWRLPQHLRECSSSSATSTGIGTPRSLSRNCKGRRRNSNETEKTVETVLSREKGGKQKKLMTSFDLEYILRLQLTSMAKLPQLQLVSGRWNFRFLRSQSTASAGTSNSRLLSPSRGESGASAFDSPLRRKPLLPSLPVEMEQHLVRLLPPWQETPNQEQVSGRRVYSSFGAAGDATALQRSSQEQIEGEVVSTTEAGNKAVDIPLLPPVLERKLHGGVGITVVDGGTRMHRLLLGSITLQEATFLLEPTQLRQPSYTSKREEAPTTAEEETRKESRGSNWLTSLAGSPDAGGSRDVDMGLLEPLEENSGEKDVPEVTEAEQQRRESAAKERELRRLQKRFGKQTYCSVRQPRSSIYVGGAAPAFSAVEEDLPSDDDAATEHGDEMPHTGAAAGSRGGDAAARADLGHQQQQGGEGSGSRLIAAPASTATGSADEKARRKFLRSLVFEGGSSGRGAVRGAAAEDLLGLTVVEDAFELLLQAAAVEDELLECPASHVTARERLVEQQQHFLLQLFELLLLRRHVRPTRVADRAFLYLVDFHPPACAAHVEEYVRVFERQLQHQEKLRHVLRALEHQQQQQEPPPQQLLHLRETGRLQQEVERLQQEAAQMRAALAVDLGEGRCYSRSILTRVYSRRKGRQLLLRSLLVLPDPQAAALVQALCSSPLILYSLCVAVDAALVPSEQVKGQQQQYQREAYLMGGTAETSSDPKRSAAETAAGSPTVAEDEGPQRQGWFCNEEIEARARQLTVPSAALLEELVLLLEVEVEGSRDHTSRKRPLLQRLRGGATGEEPFAAAAEMYVQIVQLLLRLGSTSDACSTHFITSVAQHIVWGFSIEDLVKVLEWRSGCCFFSSLIALLPPPATLTPLQHEAMQDCLKLVVSALLMTASSREALCADATESCKRQNRHLVLAPLIQTIVQQARPYECRAKIITTTAVWVKGRPAVDGAHGLYIFGIVQFCLLTDSNNRTSKQHQCRNAPRRFALKICHATLTKEMTKKGNMLQGCHVSHVHCAGPPRTDAQKGLRRGSQRKHAKRVSALAQHHSHWLGVLRTHFASVHLDQCLQCPFQERSCLADRPLLRNVISSCGHFTYSADASLWNSLERCGSASFVA